MKNNFKKMFRNSLIYSICFVVLGLFLLIKPSTTISLISYVIGGIIVIAGILTFTKCLGNDFKSITFSFDLVYSILSIIAGIIIILNPNALASLIPIVLGIWMIINGSFKFQYSFQLKQFKYKNWILIFIIAIMMIILGIVLIFNPFKGAVAITQVIGIFIIGYAILDIIESFSIRKGIKQYVNLIK